MPILTTHVLDTRDGCPAEGMEIEFFRVHGEKAELIRRVTTNHDGRTDAPLLTDTGVPQGPGTHGPGTYRLRFHAGDYFKRRGVNLPDPPFVGMVSLDFGLSDTTGHYHVPLLCSPWAWSTYRGS